MRNATEEQKWKKNLEQSHCELQREEETETDGEGGGGGL